MSITSALIPVFLLIMAGAVMRKLNFPDGSFWRHAERLTYYVLFPAMLLERLATANLAYTPITPILSNLLWVLAAGSLLLWLLRKLVAKHAAAFTSVYQGSIRFNTYIGLACADALFGSSGLVVAAITIAILIPVVNVLCVSVFHLSLNRGELSAQRLLGAWARNPLILACVGGIVLNLSGLGLPTVAASTLKLLGAAALPVGLLAVGVALDIGALKGQWREQLSAAALRFIAMPALLLIGFSFFPLPELHAQVLLLFMVLPTATSGYILARQLGGDAPLIANIITAQTLLGFIAIPAWLSF